jgi:hypothetical protein
MLPLTRACGKVEGTVHLMEAKKYIYIYILFTYYIYAYNIYTYK